MNHAEAVLYMHLSDVESLEYLARERFSSAIVQEVIPSETGRKLISWALDYYYNSGRLLAPTPEAIKETWGDEMEKVDISLGDGTETDSIQWVVEQLRSHFAYWQSQEFVKIFASSVAKADPTDKVAAVQRGATELYRLTRTLVSNRQQATLDEGIQDAVTRYERFAEDHELRGLAFGLPLIDLHYGGVREGEIAVFAGASGAGKSWVGLKALYEEWRRERQSIFFSLELSLETCFDRLACIGAGVSYARWQTATAQPEELDRVHVILERLRDSPVKPIVVAPPRGDRSMTSMVRQAQSHGSKSLIIDQLTFVTSDDEVKKGYRPKWEAIGDKMHELHEMVNDGSDSLSALIMHQMKREGIERALKSGHHEMTDMADGSEVERTASFVCGVLQSIMDRSMGRALWQTLKARRVPPVDWEMAWELEYGHIKPIRQVIPDAS